MKKQTVFKITGLSALLGVCLSTGVVTALSNLDKSVKPVDAYSTSSLPTTIDLNDTSAANIRSYYSSLNNLSTSERSGTNLLKNLKPILKNNQTYLSYDSGNSIWDVYCIVDRDWEKSPASALPAAAGTYNSSTNKITGYNWGGNKDTYENPYLHALYYNRDKTAIAQAYGDHNNNTSTGINREHIWPKGAGFDTKTTSQGGTGGARGDIMHLWAANGHANNIHSNNFYGYVDTSKSYTDIGDTSTFSMCAGNLSGKSKTFTSSSNTVFEPQDSDKGDIARACFYMVARYNYLSGSDNDGIDSNNPNLELVNNVSDFQSSGYESSTTNTGKLGILQDLLEWNRLDPPDEWEIHRNNLCYNNFTNNRNPFIDFPEWAEYIWGKSEDGSYNSTPTGSASVNSDTINGYGSSVAPTSISLNQSSITLGIGGTGVLSVSSVQPSDAYDGVKWTSSNTDVATVANNGTVTGVVAGSATITATSKLDSSVTATCSVTVQDIPVTSVSLNKTSLEMQAGAHDTLVVSYLPSNATIPTFAWTSSNESVAKVTDSGGVTAYSEGTATITVSDGNGHSASCTVSVSGTAVVLSDTTYELVTSTSGLDVSRKIAIVAKDSAYALSTTQSDNNRDATDVVKTTSDNTITMTDSIAAISIEDGINSGQYALNVTNGDTTGYLYAASSSSNYLKTESSPDSNGNASWTISIDDSTYAASIVANGTNSRATMRYNSSSTLFACYVGSTSVQDLVIYQQKAIAAAGDIDVTGVTLNKESTSIAKGSTETLVATVAPAEATNKDVTWQSSVPSVATVDANGVVTAVSVGTTVISVTTDDGDYSAQCTVTVTNQSAGTNYYQVQTSTSAITSGQYVIAAKNGSYYYPMGSTVSNNKIASTTPITVSDGKITTTNASDYVVTLTVSGTTVTIQFANGNYLKYVSSTNISSVETSYNWTLSAGTYGTFRLVSTATTTRALMYGTATSKFGGFATSNTTGYLDLELFKYTEGSGSYTVDNFVEDFLSGITCDATGSNAPTFASGYSWSELKTKYESLTPAERSELTSYVANQNGNDEAKCVARYDYIIAKYGTNTYENFMGREIVTNSNVLGKVYTSNQVVVLVIVIASLGVFSTGMYFFFKKRKFQ